MQFRKCCCWNKLFTDSNKAWNVLFPVGHVATVVGKCWSLPLSLLTVSTRTKGTFLDQFCQLVHPCNTLPPQSSPDNPTTPELWRCIRKGSLSGTHFTLRSVFSAGMELKLKHVWSLTLLKEMEARRVPCLTNWMLFSLCCSSCVYKYRPMGDAQAWNYLQFYILMFNGLPWVGLRPCLQMQKHCIMLYSFYSYVIKSCKSPTGQDLSCTI